MFENVEFERFCDFMARMIEKYGDKLELDSVITFPVLIEKFISEDYCIDFTLCVDKVA
jgi:hypothetical protein